MSGLTLQVAMCMDMSSFIILLCITADNSAGQGKSAATPWINVAMSPPTKPCFVTTSY